MMNEVHPVLTEVVANLPVDEGFKKNALRPYLMGTADKDPKTSIAFVLGAAQLFGHTFDEFAQWILAIRSWLHGGSPPLVVKGHTTAEVLTHWGTVHALALEVSQRAGEPPQVGSGWGARKRALSQLEYQAGEMAGALVGSICVATLCSAQACAIGDVQNALDITGWGARYAATNVKVTADLQMIRAARETSMKQRALDDLTVKNYQNLSILLIQSMLKETGRSGPDVPVSRTQALGAKVGKLLSRRG